MRRVSKIILSVFIWSSLTAFSYASPLKIEISLNENSPLKQSMAKDPEMLVLSTKITNISGMDQKVPVWICSYGASWVASTPNIVTGLESCTKNFIKNITLKPNESYASDLVVAISSKAKSGSLTFEMGFDPDGDWFGTRRGIDQTIERLNGIIWSNALVISVTDDMQPFLLKITEDLEQKSIKDFRSHWAENDAKAQGPISPVKWGKCSADADCGSVVVGCYSWLIANKKYFDEIKESMGPQECLQSTPPGPKPPAACIDQVCVDKWEACTQDDDCSVCSVNKKYVKEFEATLGWSCSENAFRSGSIPVAGCVKKACTLFW